MAWYPGAQKMELQPESDAQPAIRPTQLIFHSIVGPWTARRTYEYWRDSTNLESHFGVGYDGDIAQYIGTETRADANYQANLRSDGTGAISVETASNTSASDPWTDAQVEEFIKLGVWMHRHHGLPLRICRWASDPGYGYHRLHSAWAVGGGTSCPGPARVRQFHDVVFPGIVARAKGITTAPDQQQETDDMPKFVNLGCTTWTEVPPREWTAVPYDTTWTDETGRHTGTGSWFARGPALVGGSVGIRAAGLPEGRQLQVRVVEVGGDQDDHPQDAIDEVIGTPGDAFSITPIDATAGRGRALRVEVKHWQPEPVRVQARLRARVWER